MLSKAFGAAEHTIASLDMLSASTANWLALQAGTLVGFFVQLESQNTYGEGRFTIQSQMDRWHHWPYPLVEKTHYQYQVFLRTA